MMKMDKDGFTIKCNKCGNEIVISDYKDARKVDKVNILLDDMTNEFLSIYCECGNDTYK